MSLHLLSPRSLHVLHGRLMLKDLPLKRRNGVRCIYHQLRRGWMIWSPEWGLRMKISTGLFFHALMTWLRTVLAIRLGATFSLMMNLRILSTPRSSSTFDVLLIWQSNDSDTNRISWWKIVMGITFQTTWAPFLGRYMSPASSNGTYNSPLCVFAFW